MLGKNEIRLRMLTITPQSTISDVQELRNSIYELGSKQIQISVSRDYDIEYASGYTNVDVITFSWDVEIRTNDPFDRLYVCFDTEGYAEYTELNYPTWETLDTLSNIFLITANSIVINNDGSINISETMMNNNILQY